MLYAEKAIAGSLHLSGDTFKAYWLALFWMWAHSKDYSSMPNTDTAWQRATLIDDPEKLKMVRNEIMNPEFPLLKIVRKKVVSKGLKKEAKKQQNQRRKASIAGRLSGKARRDKALSAERTLNERSPHVQLKTNFPNPIPIPIPERRRKRKKETKKEKIEVVFKSNFFTVTEDTHKTYQDAYPDIKINAEYKKMVAWLKSHHKKQLTEKTEFVNNWLLKSQRAKEKEYSRKDSKEHGAKDPYDIHWKPGHEPKHTVFNDNFDEEGIYG